jgi:hypothetical protein
MIEQILSALIGRLLADEVVASVPGITGRLLKVALSQLHPWQRHRLAEEWASHLEQTRGTLHKLYEAAGFCFAARRLASESNANLTAAIAHAKEQLGPDIAALMQKLVETGWAGQNCDPGKRESLMNEIDSQRSDAAEWAIMTIHRCNEVGLTADFREAANKLIEDSVYLYLKKREQPPQ